MLKKIIFDNAMLASGVKFVPEDVPWWLYLVPIKHLVALINAYIHVQCEHSISDMVRRFLNGEIDFSIANPTREYTEGNISVTETALYPYKSLWKSPDSAYIFESVQYDITVYSDVSYWRIEMDDQLIGYIMMFNTYDKATILVDWDRSRTVDIAQALYVFINNIFANTNLVTVKIHEPVECEHKLDLKVYSSVVMTDDNKCKMYYYHKYEAPFLSHKDEIVSVE